MLIQTNVKKSSGRFLKYSLWWQASVDPLSMELDMIAHGGQWEKKDGSGLAGEGLFFHYKRFQELAWPSKIWQRGPYKNHWAEECLSAYLAGKYIGVMGCAACVRGDTKILNPITGEESNIQSLCENGIAPTVMTAFGAARATVPFVKGVAELYEVTTSSGKKFTSTLNHLVLLTTGAFCRVADLQCGNSILIAEPAPAGSTWEHVPSTHALDGLRFWQKAPDSQYDCRPCSYSYDGPPRYESAAFLESSTSPAYALEHSDQTPGERWDGRDNKSGHIHPYQSTSLLTTGYFYRREMKPEISGQPHTFLGMDGHDVRPLRPHDISVLLSNLQRSFSEPIPGFFRKLNPYVSYPRLWVAQDAVTSIKSVGVEKFYDLQVPVAHHYYAEGFIHHNSGKSDSFGCIALTDWYSDAQHTTVLVSSTDLKSLELRIWGMIKKYHRQAKSEHGWLPGHLIEGKQMLLLDAQDEAKEGRDFKSAILGVATRRGNSYVGLSSLIGIHNKRVRIIADEAQLCPRAFLDSASNLSKCEDFKLVALGNPNETTNAHGAVCEPSVELGGWEGGIDQTPGTKTWKTRLPDGICLQLPGNDSPNLRAPEGEPPPFPFLLTRQQIIDDSQMWGESDWHHAMFVDAKMPRGQGSRRVLTRQSCQKFGAFKEPNWRDSRRTSIAFVDAAYRGVGGDRCVFGELQFGYEVEAPSPDGLLTNLMTQSSDDKKGRQIIALIDLTTIPISSTQGAESPEDQIVKFVIEQCDGRGITPEHFFYDAGMRTSLVQAFARNNWQQSNSIDCGGKPTEGQVSSEIRTPCRDYYSKFVTELWFSVRMAVEASQFRGMTEDACTEFCQREWKMVSGNKIEIESKDDMKLKTGRSPDLADAVAVGLFGARQKGFRIAKLTNPELPKSRAQREWVNDLNKKARKLNASGLLNHAA